MSKADNSVVVNKAVEMDGNKVVYCESFVVSRDWLQEVIDTEFTDYESIEDFLENYVPEEDGQELYDMAESDGEIENEFTNTNEDGDGFEFSSADLDDMADIDLDDEDEFDEFEDGDISDFINGSGDDEEDIDAFDDLPEID